MRGKAILCITFFVSIFIITAGCSKENADNVETIQTYLENDFTGPSEELINVFEQDGTYPPN